MISNLPQNDEKGRTQLGKELDQVISHKYNKIHLCTGNINRIMLPQRLHQISISSKGENAILKFFCFFQESLEATCFIAPSLSSVVLIYCFLRPKAFFA